MEAFEFRLVPGYCLCNGVAVMSQKGSVIKFMLEKGGSVSRRKMKKLFGNYLERIRGVKGCPIEFFRKPRVSFCYGSGEEFKRFVFSGIGDGSGALEEMENRFRSVGLTELQLEKVRGICKSGSSLFLVCGLSGMALKRIFVDMLCDEVLLLNGRKVRVEVVEIQAKRDFLQAVRTALSGEVVFGITDFGSVEEFLHEIFDLGISSECLWKVFSGMVFLDVNLFDGKKNLLVDVVLPGADFEKLMLLGQTEAICDKQFWHYSNYSDVILKSLSEYIASRGVKFEEINSVKAKTAIKSKNDRIISTGSNAWAKTFPFWRKKGFSGKKNFGRGNSGWKNGLLRFKKKTGFGWTKRKSV